MSTSLWLAWRYLFAGRKRFAALITWTSVVGLALGVMVLTVVVSVMNGFDRELRSRLLGSIPHALVTQASLPPTDVALSNLAARVGNALEALPGTRVTPFFQGEGMLTQNGRVNPIQIFAVDNAGVADMLAPDQVFAGSAVADLAVPEGGTTRGIVIGAPLARHLGVLRGDPIALILTEPTATGVRPTLLRFDLAGTFVVGAEVDTNLALIALSALSLEQRQALGRSGVRVMLRNPVRADEIGVRLAQAMPEVQVESWTDSYGEFFRAVALEKTLMFLVLMLVVAVATFNIVSGQLMVVNEKQSDIAILRTMGARARLIRRAFTLQGVLIASFGIASGLLLGILAAVYISEVIDWVGRITDYQLLRGTYFAQLPTEIRIMDLVIIAVLAWGMSLLAAFVPAARAANLNPVAGLHLH